MTHPITRATIDALSDDERRQVFRWIMSAIQKGKPHPKSRRTGNDVIWTMLPGESRIVTWASAQLSQRAKRARVYLNQPDAKWTSYSTNRGVRVTRIR